MAGQAHKDYSGTPLPAKLGIREGSEVLLVSAPRGFTLGPLPPGVVLRRQARGPLDVIVAFATRRAELDRRFGLLAAALVDNKSASIDAVFQGVQFVIRLKDRSTS